MLIETQEYNAPALHSASSAAIRELLKEGESLNTVASYQSASRYWGEWHRLRYGTALALPLPVACVLQFIIDHAQRTTATGTLTNELPPELDAALVASGVKGKLGPLAHATMTHRLAVMSKAHQMRGLVNPCHDVQVREPAGGERVGGLVLLQEWWGVNDHIRSIAERMAKEGFLVLAPDLYHGKLARDATEAGQLMTALDTLKAVDEVAGAARYLKEHARSNGKVGVFGF